MIKNNNIRIIINNSNNMTIAKLRSWKSETYKNNYFLLHEVCIQIMTFYKR